VVLGGSVEEEVILCGVPCMTLMMYARASLARKGALNLGRVGNEIPIDRILPAGIGTACSFRSSLSTPLATNPNDIIHTKKV